MRTNVMRITLLGLLTLVVRGDGCVLEEKVVDVILNETVCADFAENSQSATFGSPVVVDYAAQIDLVLADNGLVRADIDSVVFLGGSYGVTAFAGSHPWTIAGRITVERQDVSDGPVDILSYSSYTVDGASVGVTVIADLDPAGVALLNRALEDFIDPDGTGDNPVLVFTTVNESVSPTPSASDPIVFDWRACLDFQVISQETVEVPDPF